MKSSFYSSNGWVLGRAGTEEEEAEYGGRSWELAGSAHRLQLCPPLPSEPETIVGLAAWVFFLKAFNPRSEQPLAIVARASLL